MSEPKNKPTRSKMAVPETVQIPDGVDMLQFLQDVALGRIEASPVQVRAAVAAVQYTHTKTGDGGKKEAREDAARKVSSKFAASQPPRLVASGGRKVG